MQTIEPPTWFIWHSVYTVEVIGCVKLVIREINDQCEFLNQIDPILQ